MAKAKKLKSGSWNCVVYSHTETILQPDGTKKEKRIYKSFTCDIPGPQGKRACEAMAAEWAEHKEETAKQRENDITFGQALDQYIANRSAVLSPSTVREYKRSRKRDFTDIENISIGKITQEDIQIAVNKASLSLSPKTVRNIHGLISAVMRVYRPDFVMRTEMPKKRRPDLYTPTDNDVKRIIAYLRENDKEMEKAVLLAAFGPLRRGEICALRYEDINENVIHVHRAMALNFDRVWVEKAPKTYASDRYIHFPDEVIKTIGSGTGKIFPFTPDVISHRFAHITQNAGVPHFRFHDLRHYCASILHAINIPDQYIMARGGWLTPAVLDSVYRHAMDDREKEMNDKANEHFAKLTVL